MPLPFLMRAFIVGTGTSLNRTPLDKLSDEVCYSVNNIHLLYSRTSWRPTHYVRAEEPYLWSQPPMASWLKSVQTHLDLGIKCYLSKFFLNPFKGYDADRIERLKMCHHYMVNYDDTACPHTWHDSGTICSFGSSLHVAIQLAIRDGFGPLYLLGCDLGYKDGESAHFDTRYEHGYEMPAMYANNNLLAAHMQAKRSSQVDIFNATVGGYLEVYPRVDIEEIV